MRATYTLHITSGLIGSVVKQFESFVFDQRRQSFLDLVKPSFQTVDISQPSPRFDIVS